MRVSPVSCAGSHQVGITYIAAAILAAALAVAGPARIDEIHVYDLPYFTIIVAHAVWGLITLCARRRFARRRMSRSLFIPEVLFAVSLLFFLFAYIYAANAGMDYVERFIEAGGDLRLTLDTSSERLIAFTRFAPFLLVNLFWYAFMRLRRRRLVTSAWPTEYRSSERNTVTGLLAPWSLLFSVASAVLMIFSFPSFAVLDGLPLLGWFGLVPLLVVFRINRFPRAVFYGVFFGTALTLVSNFWLGTFSLISLQFAVVLFFLYYLVFVPAAVAALKFVRRASFLVVPAAWTVFELARSSGFLGYPWTLMGHSQYAQVSLIQVSALTGVWAVSFLVLLVNSGISEGIWAWLRGLPWKRAVRPPAIAVATVLLVTAGGAAATGLESRRARAEERDVRSVRVALIQQNSDPRKHEYRRTLDALKDLTDRSLSHDPDLVAWSETAFPPNLRRWETDDSIPQFHLLVNEFLDYQAQTETWLLTGNDDYEVIRDEEGREIERHSYNATVLFSDEGERVKTYRKVRLVPFTEHFPYKDVFPGIYALLKDFDVHFWEPGTERTVFEHPKFAFATPICFEDVFPNEVRLFVAAGAEVILNVTNDYWSLTEVQAKQHFAGGMFRAVENRRPLLRSTASGLTAHVDPYGRVLRTLPYYQEAYAVVEVDILVEQPTTAYTRFGDWFVAACGLLLAGLVAAEALYRRFKRNKGKQNGL